MIDPFDALLISDCDILARPTTRDADGQVSGVPVKIATVRARLSGGKGKVREFKADKKVATAYHVIFMRPYPALTVKHWLKLGGKTYDIIHIDNPSGMDHHYECTVEEIEP